MNRRDLLKVLWITSVMAATSPASLAKEPEITHKSGRWHSVLSSGDYSMTLEDGKIVAMWFDHDPATRCLPCFDINTDGTIKMLGEAYLN